MHAGSITRPCHRRRPLCAWPLRVALILAWLLALAGAHSWVSADNVTVEGQGHLLISEVMVDPHQVSDELGEWIEVTSTDDSDVDLRGWSFLVGNQRHLIAGESIVRPGQYVVFARSLNPSENGGVPADFPLAHVHLRNSEDEVRLVAPSGEIVDHVEWGSESGLLAPMGASLERQGADRHAPWAAAQTHWPGSHGDSGSPGAPYSPAPATALPAPTSPPAATEAATDTPAATPSPTYTPATTPTQTLPPPTDTPTPPPAHPPRIRLSEIMANPAAVDDEAGEWLEVLNADGIPVNLRDWSFADQDTDRLVIAADLWIQPGAYLVLGRNGDATSNGGVGVHYVYQGLTLANESDELLLTAPWGAQVDSLRWGEDTPLRIPKGASLERTGFGDGDGWATASQPWPGSHGDFGSPGSPYMPPQPTPTLQPTATLAAAWSMAGAPSPLAIDEVYAESADHEYVVLCNLGNESISLGGSSIGDAEHPGDGEGIHALPREVTLQPGALYVIARNGAAFAGRWGFAPDAELEDSDASIPTLPRVSTWASGSMALNDDGDEVLLFNAAMQVADAVAYGDGFGAAAGLAGELHLPGGYSLQRVPGFRYPEQVDIRYRFLVAPPQPTTSRQLPQPQMGDHPALGGGMSAVWGTMGARSTFSDRGQAPPHYIAAAAAANGLDYVAVADPDRVHAQELLCASSPVLCLPAWHWHNADGAEAVVYSDVPAHLQSWADLRDYLDAHGACAQAQVEEPPAIRSLTAAAADQLRADDHSSLLHVWQVSGLPNLPAGNSMPPTAGTGSAPTRYTGLAVTQSDLPGIRDAVSARRGWMTSSAGLWLSLRVHEGAWMGQTIAPANEVVLDIRYGDRTGEAAGLALWQDNRPVHHFEATASGQAWTVRVPAVPGSYLYAVATQLDGDFAVTAPLLVRRAEGGQALLNEVLPSPWQDWNGDGIVDSNDEFVELYNSRDTPMALQGYRLSDRDGENSPGRQFVFGPGRYVPARGHLVLWHADTRLSLNNDGDRIRLLNPSGEMVDEVSWSQLPGEGLSIARLPDGGTWTAGAAVTPGMSNHMPDGNTSPPRARTNSDDDGGQEAVRAEIATKVEQGQATGPPGSLASAKLQGIGAGVEFRAKVIAPPGLFNSAIYVAEPAASGEEAGVAGIGIQVYLRSGEFAEMAEGDWVLVRGRLRSFRGELEAQAEQPGEVWCYEDGRPLQPLPIRAYDVGESLEGRLVTFTGEVTGWQGDSFYLCDPERPDVEIRITVRSSLGWRRPYVNKGERWQVTGIVSQFAREHPWNGGYRVLVRYPQDLAKLAVR